MKIFLLFVLLFSVQLVDAQNDRIETLQAEMRGAFGIDRVQKLITLSELCFQSGRYEEAEDWAGEAAEFARKLKAPELRAIALNREGKAIMQTGKKGLFGKDRTGSKFLLSTEILRGSGINNQALALDNLENLRILAQKTGKTKDLAEIDAQISRLKNGGLVAPDAPVSRQDLRSELSNLQKELAKQQSERNATALSQAELQKQSQELQAQLAAKEAAIGLMSEKQVKAELILMQQRQMLDSLTYRGKVDSLSLANWNLALRESESNRNFNYAIMAVLLLLAAGSTFSFVRARQNAKVLEEKNKMIREEQQRSENLLLNILPSLVADELKQQGRTRARFYADASVLFADFVGFSSIAEQLSPQQLVTELDTCFQAFDEIIAKYGLEKIKTIGDAYMCAGGLYNAEGNQLLDLTKAAVEMQQWLSRWDAERKPKGLPCFEARIGIHHGPLVAGVVGSRKFAFDIWGDTVNIAARIEQAGEGGKINISGEAHTKIQEYFNCLYRGKIAVKNKGNIDMYFVEN